MGNFTLSDAAVEMLARLLRSVPDDPAPKPTLTLTANGKGYTNSLLIYPQRTEERK